MPSPVLRKRNKLLAVTETATKALPPSVTPVLAAKVTVPDEVPMLTMLRSNVLPTVALGTAASINAPMAHGNLLLILVAIH